MNAYLVVLVLLLVPAMNYGEVAALFQGAVVSQVNTYSGAIKAIKDFYFLSAFILVIIAAFLGKRLGFKVWFSVHFSIFLICVPLVFSLENSLVYTASGIRWCLPFVLMFLYPLIFDIDKLRWFALVLVFLLFLNFTLQVFQVFFAGGWYGEWSGLNIRNPGVFLIPSTSAIFVCFAFFFVWCSNEFSRKFVVLLFVFSGLSIVLTVSATGVLLFSIICLFFVYEYSRKLFILFVPLVLSFLLIFYQVLLLRHTDFLAISGGGRLSILLESLYSSGFLSDQFGVGTNTAVILSEGIIADSFYSSLVINLGWFALSLFVVSLFVMAIFLLFRRRCVEFCFLLLLMVAMCSTVITEVFPVNLIIIMLFSMFVNRSEVPSCGGSINNA